VKNNLLAIVREDSDLEVRKKAVFALSQLDDGEGVQPLVDLVRTGRETEIRREALFWLGQSDDPRALESLETLLLKK
jgi:HEAT repeat protein